MSGRWPGLGAMLVLMACAPGASPEGTWELRPGAQEPVYTPPEGGEETATPTPTPEREPPEPGAPGATLESTGVLVIGSGPAGLAAGIAASEAGAEVVILERDSVAGAGITYATRAFAVGTRYQAAAGVEDSAEDAAAEWSSLTGVSGAEPGVLAFLEASSETLDWLVDRGFIYIGLSSDPDAGVTPRMHQVRGEETRLALIENFQGDIRLGVEATELLVREGRVIGARWTDVETGRQGTLHADAVIITTGGFLRDQGRVEAARPDLAGRRMVYETNPESDGGGLAFLERVGAAFSAREHIGVYVHAVPDPERDEGEALILGGLDQGLVVDSLGMRFMDEAMTRSFDFFDAAPDDEIYAILPDRLAERVTVTRPQYNWEDPGVEEKLTLEELALLSSDVAVAATPTALAALAGLDAEGLEATVAEVGLLSETGGVDAFGREFTPEALFTSDLWWSVRLTPGLAKAFGGVVIDTDARVLDAEGEPIPGLYAAGEVAGMLPNGGAGSGFAGSVLACYYYGRVAGTLAAAQQRARPEQARR